MTDAYASLRLPAVRRYIAGRFLASVGRQMLGVAIGWQLYDRTRSVMALGLVGLVQVVPVLLLALPAGHMVDRRNRRDMAIAGNALLVSCGLALATLSHFNGPVWAFYVALFFNGVAVAFESPSSGSLMAQIIPPALFANANAWRSSSGQLASMAGPALAGVLIALRDRATPVYAIQAMCCVVYTLILLTLARPPTPVPSRGPIKDELRAGLRFVFKSQLLLPAITLDMFAVLLGGATALLPVFAKEILHVGPSGLGWLRAAPAMGALTMALVTTRIEPWQRAGRTLLITVAGFGVAIFVFGLSRSFALSMCCLALTGLFDNVSVVIRLTLEQLVTPDRLRGRVSAVHYVFIGLSNEMGAFESGFTAALLGPVGSVLMGGLGTLLVVLLVAWHWPALRRLGPLAALSATDEEPNTARAA